MLKPEIIECEKLGVNEVVIALYIDGVMYRGCISEVIEDGD